MNPHASDKPPTMKGQIQKGATVANGAAGKENENNAVKKAEVGGNEQETKAAPKKESLTEKLYATLTNTLCISNNRTVLRMPFNETAVLFWFAASRRGRYPPALIHEHNRKREAAEKEVAKEKAAKERAVLTEKYGGGEMKKEEVAKSMEAGLCVCL